MLLAGGCRAENATGGGSTGAQPNPGATAPAGAGVDVGPVLAWQWSPPRPANVGMPAADADGVVASYGHLRLAALGGEGGVEWETERIGLRDVAPRLANGLVLAATDDGVVGVDRRTGRIRWDSILGERANTPTSTGGRAVASTWEGSLVALDLEGGTEVWRTGMPGLALGPAASHGTTVVATWESKDGPEAGLMAVDAATGRERWRAPLQRNGVSAPAVVALGPDTTPGAVVVVVDGGLAAHGFDMATGRRLWTTPLGGAGSPEIPPLVLPSGRVLVTDRLGGLSLLDGTDGRVRWEVVADQGAALRGGPAGPTPGGRFVLPLDDGTLLVARDGVLDDILDPPGRVSGVVIAGDQVLVATRESGANALFAVTGW